MRAWGAALLLPAACGFESEFAPGYRCPTGVCPAGEVCIEGVCVSGPEDIDARTVDAPPATIDAAGLDPSLVAWYRFEDTPELGVEDSTGNGHLGTCAGAACPVRVAGRIGMAYAFDGGDHVSVDGGGVFATMTALTVAGWARLDVPSNQAPVSKPRHVDGAMDINSWQVEVEPPARACLTGPSKVCVDDGIEFGPWLHFAATWDGSEKRLLIDGAEVLSTSANLILDDHDVIIGADYRLDPVTGQPTDVFVHVEGLLDEIRIYDRALTDGEIAALANP